MPSDFDHPFLNLARERVLILDGAMGTSLHRYQPTDKDWGYAPNGKSLMNLSDALVYTHPEWIREIHRGFLAAGCDGIETNTFNASQIVLDEFGMGDKLDEINRLNIRLAKEVAAEFTHARPAAVRRSARSAPARRCRRSPTRPSTPTSTRLADAYRPQIRVMIEERVDAILIETCFDILQAKCVAITAIEEMKRAGVRLPLMVQLTIIDARQKMLPGTDIPAALVALDPLDEIDVIGMNCGVGPDLMLDGIRHLSRHSRQAAQRAAERRPARNARRRDVLPARPGRAGRLAGAVRHRVRRQHHRRLLRHHARPPRRRSSTASAGRSPRRATPMYLAGRVQPAIVAGTASSIRGRCSSASGPTRTARGSSSNSSKRRTGTAWPRWPRSRSARASTSSTCASTTSAATASAT